MTIREELEIREKEILAPWACLSMESRGREREEVPCDIRPAFQRDRDRILHCKSFRRLREKTQVFLSPKGDHYRTRLTHTLEVSQNARTIAKALRLNEDLVEAIALGHDLGHTPFGHAGERALNRVCPLGFSHTKQSVRIVERLERNGRGLNLCWEVRDGILNHQTSGTPATLEGQVVRLSDKIAYFHHDMDDAMRAGVLTEADVPKEITEVVGRTTGERLDTFIHDLIRTSQNRPQIVMSPPVAQAMKDMRAFMFRRVYTDRVVKAEEEKAEKLVEVLYGYYLDHTDELPELFRGMIVDEKTRYRAVCDYISSMSDRFAITRYGDLFVPRVWSVL
ncbi:MAG: deoxyguanosinetriphosphate triphosphohydrolase [Lachnospiraceae bacterium]|nr:deoxyguanosinetriphosphate triphosphohydrolase [Lachnospiraceae bacterium]